MLSAGGRWNGCWCGSAETQQQCKSTTKKHKWCPAVDSSSARYRHMLRTERWAAMCVPYTCARSRAPNANPRLTTQGRPQRWPSKLQPNSTKTYTSTETTSLHGYVRGRLEDSAKQVTHAYHMLWLCILCTYHAAHISTRSAFQISYPKTKPSAAALHTRVSLVAPTAENLAGRP